MLTLTQPGSIFSAFSAYDDPISDVSNTVAYFAAIQ